MPALTFFCCLCGHALRAAAEGPLFVECRRCFHVVPRPGRGTRAKLDSVLPAGVLALELVFQCGHCAGKLRIDARAENQAVRCPHCQRLTTVPGWSQASAVETEPDHALSSAEVDFLAAAFAEEENVR